MARKTVVKSVMYRRNLEPHKMSIYSSYAVKPSPTDHTPMTPELEIQADRFIPLKPVVFEIVMSLAQGTRHGYAILRDVRTRSVGRMKLETGPGPDQQPEDT